MSASASPISAHADSNERDYLSYSAINTYRACPLRYYFRYVLGLEEATVSASLVFGSAIHRAIEHHFRAVLSGSTVPELADLLDAYRQGWSERNDKPVKFNKSSNRESLDDLATRMLGTFRESAAAQPEGRILAVEEELRGELIPGVPDLLGKVDLVTETADALLIADWKTSRSRWSAAQLADAAEQLLLYSELVRDFAPGKRLVLEFVVITKAKAPFIDCHRAAVTLQAVVRMKRIVERVWHAIEAKHFYPAPSALNCPTCPFRAACREWPG